ncbi:uncharacterized protein HRG_02013 [Hirsutella rhossiliensis]|uniref:Uncharacterized protein n=1 Tax=Hirsutella rhossiliensis TaxID=111463 RepID=A0A9P8SLT3_9HYPO|nr:uncharacterized protein HRG_02013 [Hirsutella rhossiliensis]KAH0966604.1 hypothetical protein HRG_02013 [Hirsutella rhossiliensis]
MPDKAFKSLQKAGGKNIYPADVNKIDFTYNSGTKLRDATIKEAADYYRRVVDWYVNGGFTDECGVGKINEVRARLNPDIRIGFGELHGYPGQFESVSIVDYRTGEPNARFRVLEMLQQNFQAGDSLLATAVADDKAYYAQAYRTVDGRRKLLLINKTA